MYKYSSVQVFKLGQWDRLVAPGVQVSTDEYRCGHVYKCVQVHKCVQLGKWSESCFDTDWVYEILVIGR